MKYVYFTVAQQIVNYVLINKVSIDDAIKALKINATTVDKLDALRLLMTLSQ